MKEYKIIKQKAGLFMKDSDFEDLLNNEARNGWKLINVVLHGGALKAFMEKSRI
ncbi:DUF4177 domain-containing protein [Leptobacterium flavescens]|uniref:DUF4177 domain-containing protein n=1 Tax=Leptobacterium flavescens TaxID=472055 RepID=A0A6P0UGY8_9FLAO|nr:DUF4177 domain-containing protein [Leptobacterium flavescens]NER12277.1 DUF4177 domain-containing protein [Leptobacterium flavescens]